MARPPQGHEHSSRKAVPQLRGSGDLSAMLGTEAIGIDLAETTEAPIEYRQFDGRHFPIGDNSVDAALLCYVLHHAQDLGALMSELRRVLREDGLAVVYEDIPESCWDRLVCSIHNFKWQSRTGRCTFRLETEWRTEFEADGFDIVKERRLSRSRNVAHPVRRRLYLLRKKEKDCQ